MNMILENFASWNGVLDDGRISCEWVVSFYIDNHYDGTATIYVKSMIHLKIMELPNIIRIRKIMLIKLTRHRKSHLQIMR